MDDFDLEDEDSTDGVYDDDHEGGIAADSKLYVRVKDHWEGFVPLAFTIPDDIPPMKLGGLIVTWTPEAMAAFSAIRRAARDVDTDNDRNLPYAYLRGAIEVEIKSAVRIEQNMGLSRNELERRSTSDAREPRPFAYFEAGSAAEVSAHLHRILYDWIVQYLVPRYAEPGQVPDRLTNRAADLATAEQLVRVAPFDSKVMPWEWKPSTGTTSAPDRFAFQSLVDLAAKSLAGKVLIEHLGPMRRIISATGRDNEGELVTVPRAVGNRGRMSLVVRLRVETIPTLHQPLLLMDIVKRRWLGGLDKSFGSSQIKGTVFSALHPDRAFAFWVFRRKKVQGAGWETTTDFEAIRRTLGLPLQTRDALAIIRGEADTATAQAFLVYRAGRTKIGPGLEAGVPERDKLDAFHAAVPLLRDIGLKPFDAIAEVRCRRRANRLSLARMADETALLTRINPSLMQEVQGPVQSNPIDAKTSRKRAADLDQLVDDNRAALRRMYGDKPPTLVIFHAAQSPRVDLQLLKETVGVLWPDLRVVLNRLPEGAHGPEAWLRKTADAKRAPAAQRAQQRVMAWRDVAQQMRRSDERYLCLIMANMYYPDPADPTGKVLRDDPVNKPSTRRALAKAGAAVQFLLPRHTKRGQADNKDFLHRMQSALRDLISAHWGRIDTVAVAVHACFPEERRRPREIIGITIVRKHTGWQSQSEASFIPIAMRLNVATGRCDLRFAYQSQADSYATTGWEHLPVALSSIAGLSPVKLADTLPVRRTRFMEFVNEIIGDAVEDGAQPVVLIDSSNTAGLWPWLRDSDIDPANIVIANKQWMQHVWEGARIIRIRQGRTPGIVENKSLHLAETTPEDHRRRNAELDVDISIPVPTAPGGGLFRLSEHADGACVVYASIGRKTLHQNKRGLSCYRPVLLTGKPTKKIDGKFVPIEPAKNAGGHNIWCLTERAAHVGQWASPNPLEVTVTLRQKGDSPDRLAEFVERLRYGFGHYDEWTSLPAPLFFERVVRDYVSHFEIEDAEQEEAFGGEEEN